MGQGILDSERQFPEENPFFLRQKQGTVFSLLVEKRLTI